MAEEKSLFKRVGAFFGIGERPRAPAKTTNMGTAGTPIIGGYINLSEKNAKLRGTTRYKTFDEYKANVAVIGTGIRNCLTLFEGITWTLVPDERLPGFDDPKTLDIIKEVEADLATMRQDLSVVARRQALAKFDGFAIQVWTAGKKLDGKLGVAKCQVRPPGTIEKFVRDPDTKELRGVLQRDPETGELLWIDRERMIYTVDDQLTDVECGMGLLRHAVTDARIMGVYENLENIGYQTDMQGMPIGRAPLGELKALLDTGDIDETEYNLRRSVLSDILNNHVKTGNLSVLLDSATYEQPDGSPSAVYKYDVELVRGDQGSKYDAIDRAIERRELRIARLFGIEHLFIGTSSKGGYSQSADRSKSYGQMVNSLALAIANDLRRDLIVPMLILRGLPEDAPIRLMPDATNLRDAAAIVDGMWKVAQQMPGGVLTPDDPAFNYMRKVMQVPPAPKYDEETKLAMMQTAGHAPPPPPPQDPNKIDPATGKPFKAPAGAAPKPGAPMRKDVAGIGDPSGATGPGPAAISQPAPEVAVGGGARVQVGVFVTGEQGSPGLPADGWVNVVEPVE